MVTVRFSGVKDLPPSPHKNFSTIFLENISQNEVQKIFIDIEKNFHMISRSTLFSFQWFRRLKFEETVVSRAIKRKILYKQ